jgi:hypothetical protein
MWEYGRQPRFLRWLKWLLALIAVVSIPTAAFALGAAGSPKAATTTSGPTTALEPTTTPQPPPACVASVRKVSRRLHRVESRLQVGLNVGEYTDLVGEARVAYDAANPDAAECNAAMQHFDMAILVHTTAATGWQLCINEYPHCFVDSVGLHDHHYYSLRVFKLYKHWERAEREIERGDDALNAVLSGSAPANDPTSRSS